MSHHCLNLLSLLHALLPPVPTLTYLWLWLSLCVPIVLAILGEKLVVFWTPRQQHLCFFGFLHSTSASAYKLVCYFTSWSQYRQEPGKFTAESIDPFLCSHLIYAFANISNNKLTIDDKDATALYQAIGSLKTKSVGWGWEHLRWSGRKDVSNSLIYSLLSPLHARPWAIFSPGAWFLHWTQLLSSARPLIAHILYTGD